MKKITSKEFSELTGNPLFGSKWEEWGELKVGEGFHITEEEWKATGNQSDPAAVIVYGTMYSKVPDWKFRNKKVNGGWAIIRVK